MDCNPETHSDLTLIEVLDMLNTLDEEKRQIVVLRLYTELPYKEIASIMGIGVVAAQKKYQ